MKSKNSLFFLLALVTFLWSCGDDDDGTETPGTVTLSDLQDSWVDLSISNGSSDDGFVIIRFTGDPADGIIDAFSLNSQNFECDATIFRNVEPASGNTFSGEGRIDLSTDDWVPVVITLDNEDQIAVAYTGCDGCDFIPDVMAKLNETITPVPVLIDNDIDEDMTLIDLVCDPSQPDYVVEDWVSIDAVLTIEPGVVMEFGANSGLVVGEFGGGAISAKGISGNPITFTGETKTKGFWGGIVIETYKVFKTL